MNTRTLPAAFRFALNRHDDPKPPVPPVAPPTPPVVPAPAPGPAPKSEGDPNDPPLGPAGEKALEEWKRRAKEAETAAKTAAEKVREFEDRDKSELEKAQALAARATVEAEKARTELARTRILAEHKLSEADAEFLPSGTEDEMRAAAARLAERIAAATPAPKGGPRPDPSQGSGRPVTPTDYRTAPKGDVQAKLRELGVRSYK
jgi:hypothetical protein